MYVYIHVDLRALTLCYALKSQRAHAKSLILLNTSHLSSLKPTERLQKHNVQRFRRQTLLRNSFTQSLERLRCTMSLQGLCILISNSHAQSVISYHSGK
jgi:hypothetical protein